MRNLSNYIALSLLAAAFAGCSSTDTGSTSTSSNDGQDPLTGPLAVYQGSIKALTGTPTFASGTGVVTIPVASGELVVLSKRSVDSALLVNGVACPADVVTHVAATATTIKSINLTGGGGAETVLIDIRNGKFAPASATGGGISVSLGGGDNVAILGATTADKMGCARTTGTIALPARDAIGLASATSKDVTIAPVGVNTITIDLNDGDDSFDQGNCQTQMTVYGGKGKDTITATAEPAPGDPALKNDTFSGGADPDTLSYANRTTAVAVNLSAAPLAVPFAMAAGKAGATGEADSITDDFETITTGSGDDAIYSGSALSTYILNGGVGADTFVTQTTHGATVNGGTGTDTIDYSARSTKVTVDMSDSKATDGESSDTDNVGKDVENIVGTGLGDTLTGNALNNVFSFATGHVFTDTMNGGDGDDTFLADSAADGNDVFNGGNGSDTVDYSAHVPGGLGVCVFLDNTATSGTCTIAVATPAVQTSGSEAPAAFTVTLGAETDKINSDVENVTGTANSDKIVGSAVANVIQSKGGADWIIGGTGDDTLDANSAAGACSANTLMTCGADPLDVATCKNGVAIANFVGCALKQTN